MRLSEDEYNALISRRAGTGLAEPPNSNGAKKAIRQSRREYRDYKAEFLGQLRLAGLPQPEAEFRFAPPRMWRFDWAYQSQRVAVEYQGGNYTGKGGHNTVKGLKNDYEKFTEAALRGWMLVLIDSESVRDGRAVTWVERALRARMKINGERNDDIASVI